MSSPFRLTCVGLIRACHHVRRSWVSSPVREPLSLFSRMALFLHAGPRVTGDAQPERRPWEGWLRPDGWIAPAPCPWEPWKLKACGGSQLCHCLHGLPPSKVFLPSWGHPAGLPPPGHSPFPGSWQVGAVLHLENPFPFLNVGSDFSFLFCFYFFALTCVTRLGFHLLYVTR